MDLKLKDRVVIVTGGAAGIGGAISVLLAQEGAIPVIYGRSPMSAEFTERLMSLQPRSLFCQLDLRDENACRKAVRHGLKKTNRSIH